ncbi:ABC transporter permease subunit [Alphaproteobacteria bacterium]|nr:ABC transporter permease subunit [Alphaproteobacteria bacterium]
MSLDQNSGVTKKLNKNIILYLSIFIIGATAYYLSITNEDPTVFPKSITDEFKFTAWINAGEDYLKDNYRWITRLFASFLQAGYMALENFFVESPWILVMSLMTLPALAYGGIRLALFCMFTVYFWGAVDMWEVSMQTLALMGLSVILSVVFGVILGILSSQNDRFESFLKPILDTMQVMPAFVYLFPAMFFFGIGGAPAILATLIYAMPPIIRLTNLGIRQVSKETIESAESFGSNKYQLLFKIKIPMALPSIMMGVNQTIMMALALVVLATFIGAEGLGGQVWQAIRKLDVGWAMESGLCILFMAIMFDRLSSAISKDKETLPDDVEKFYLLPQSLQRYPLANLIELPLRIIVKFTYLIFSNVINLLANFLDISISIFNKSYAGIVKNFMNQRYFLFSSLLIFVLIYICDAYFFSVGTFPETWTIDIQKPIENTVKAMTLDPGFISFAKGLKYFIYLYLLKPLNVFLTQIPWWYTMIVFIIIGYVTVGLRFATITAILLAFIGATGMWMHSMITLSSVLVSVLICFVIGVPLGVIASYNKWYRDIQNVVLDAMQTLPYFCYLIPVLMFFGGNIVSAVIATVIYSVPPIIRLTALGLSQVSGGYSEVSKSFGGTGIQTLNKVKFPLAVPSLVMGFNQTVIMAFAMQIVTPLIGGKGLGLQVFNALQRSDTGRGLSAGLAIVLLAIIIDRITHAWTKKQRQALGLDQS